MKFELKKVLSKTGSRIALILLAGVVALSCWLCISGSGWVNDQGEQEYGIAAIRKRREAKKAWAGVLDEQRLSDALTELQRIAATPEARSSDVRQNNIAYSWEQGLYDLRFLINQHLSPSFQEFDYYLATRVPVSAVSSFYSNRIQLLKTFLESSDSFSQPEKAYLIEKYEQAQTPYVYDYADGWIEGSGMAVMPVMICSLVLGFLVAGFFADEFRYHSDAILFSTRYGRNRAVRQKLQGAFLLVTVAYWSCMLVYSAVVLGVYGFDGASCQIQANYSGYKCFYNMTNGQKYALILGLGYLGNLFFAGLTMWVSAKTRSAVLAVTVPFILIFLPNFFSNMESESLNKVLAMLPDRLMQIDQALKYFDLVSVGGRVCGAIPVNAALYGALTAALVPVCYREFRRKQVI